jgi:SAM-dependent methyltransferase
MHQVTKVVSRIKAKWLKYAPEFWWGDNIDSRFILSFALEKIRKKKVLDIGCNAGVILSEVENSNCKVGVDINPQAISIARNLNSGSLMVRADMARLPFADSIFDVVILAHMLQVPRDVKGKKLLIEESQRVLKPQGTIFITTPNRRYRRYLNLFNMLTFEELDNLLKPYFDYYIKGFNCFPPFPFFLPNALIAKIPGIWGLLLFLMEKGFLRKQNCSFFVKATKRTDGLK